jgi:hypothetical protein
LFDAMRCNLLVSPFSFSFVFIFHSTSLAFDSLDCWYGTLTPALTTLRPCQAGPLVLRFLAAYCISISDSIVVPSCCRHYAFTSSYSSHRRECLVRLLVVVKRYVVKKKLVCAAQHTSFHVLRKDQYLDHIGSSFEFAPRADCETKVRRKHAKKNATGAKASWTAHWMVSGGRRGRLFRGRSRRHRGRGP